MSQKPGTTADDDAEAPLVPVGPGAEASGEDADESASLVATDKKGAAAVDAADGADGADNEDSRVGHGEGADDDEQREARRRERADRKRRQKEARERDERELNFLRRRNEDLERRQSQIEARVTATESVTIQGRLQQIDTEIENANDVIAKAVTAAKGEDVVAAQKIRDELLEARRTLVELQKARSKPQTSDDDGAQNPPPRQAAPQLSPDHIRLANEWRKKNSWFTGAMDDPEQAATVAIDKRVKAEGYDPATQEYWDELSKRVSKMFPHRSKGSTAGTSDDDDDDDDDASGARGARGVDAPSFSTRGKERTLKKGEVYISAERKQAMIDAGVWEDPKLRQRYLRSYARYDAEAKSGGRS